MGFLLVQLSFRGLNVLNRKLRFTKNRKNKNFCFWKGMGLKAYFWLSRLSALDALFYALVFGISFILRS